MAVSVTNRRTTLTLPASTLWTGAEDLVRRMSRAFVGLTEDDLLLVNGRDGTERKRKDRRRR